jgi:imidazolonepropionase-like amidohydrolase
VKRALLCLCLAAGPAAAQDLLIRHAVVHTAGARGTLQSADVFVRGGKVAAVGANLTAPAGVAVVEARGRHLTPGLFAGFSDIGLEEVSAEKTTVDSAVAIPGTGTPQTRPEFDVTLAYNPASLLLPVARLGGLTFTALNANSGDGSLIAGQGGVMRLDGDVAAAPIGPKLLFVNLGAGADGMSGGSRAAQYMLLEQAIREARGLSPYGSPYQLLTPTGRETLARFLANGRVVFNVDRAADIRQLLAFCRRHSLRPLITGGAEAWKLAAQLKAANATVFVDALQNLPSSFDQLGSRLDNAALLARAGVDVAMLSPDATHNARKIRQAAGNAVANGLPWEDGLASITRVPAQALGVGDRLGRIEPGMEADLALWDGDPLELTTLADQVWMHGQPMPMRSRQTELRDRYLAPPSDLPRAYSR